MSGIYIPNRELPTSCRDCFVAISMAAFPSCPLAGNYAVGKGLVCEGLGNNVRPSGCPLLPIPDHGRLIDADEVRKIIDTYRPGRIYEDAWALTVMDNAPTIIPADGYVKQDNHRAEIERETTTESRSCGNCRFYELRERYEREPHNKLEPYCKLNCRWIGNTGKCGEWMVNDGKS